MRQRQRTHDRGTQDRATAKKRDANPLPKSDQPATTGFAVGNRVVTRHSSDSAMPEDLWPNVSGVIVDDFNPGLPPQDDYGRTWAISKRWAVALDTGSLVFRNDSDLARES